MIVALDLETTGLLKEKDFIIEIALIKFDEHTFEIIEEYTSLVNPGIKIPDLNTNITGITDEMVFASPSLDELKEKIREFIGDSPILGHNTYFDRDFLIEKGIDINKNIVLDTFFIANFLSIGCKSMSLESLTSYYSIELSGAHRAYNDTLATVLLFKTLLGEFNKLNESKKNLLGYFFSNTKDKNVAYIKNLFFKSEIQVDFNEFVTLQLDKITKIKIPKIVPVPDLEDQSTKKETVSDCSKNRHSCEGRNLSMINTTILKEDIFIDSRNKSENDGFSDFLDNPVKDYFSKIPNFENRDNQISMAEKIYNNFFSNKKTTIEAPTGIGKTLAYLIPAILYSKKVNKKVFISTKTKILQDQIYFKDLEIIKNNLDITFNYTKIKGKKNYISLKSFFDFIQEFELDYEKVSFLSKMSLWLCSTDFGELDEVFYTANEYKFLKYVNADNNQTLDDKNPYLKKEFVYKQKINLELADIVVINHSLLFSDLKNDFSFFGKVENLVIDEAHSIEDIATESLKNSFSIKVLEDLLNYIEAIFKYNYLDITPIQTQKADLLSNIKLFLDVFYSYLKEKTNNENFFINSLLDDSFYSLQTDYFYKLGENVKNALLDIKESLLDVKVDFAREINLVDKIVDIVDKVVDKSNNQEYIKIAHYREYEGVKLEYTILDIGKYLRTNFWDYLNNCFLLSATLSIASNFDYVKKSLHLEGFEFMEYKTDFDYNTQAVLYIPKDLGSIKNNFSAVTEFLKDVFSIVKGNTMVLFTALSAVRNVYINLNFFTKSIGSKLLAQSISGSKNKILDSFLQEHQNSIILGTDSFWEGIDIPGKSLEYLIIHKIPFMVPTDPIYISRSKLFANPFSDYSVPKSILKLKQGFGRLIRTKKDKGVVIFLDDRIHSTDWGKVFINAFPKDINMIVTTKKHIIELLTQK